MTMHKGRGEAVSFECDACDDTVEGDDFDEGREELRANGWLTKKNEKTGQWRHFCRACKPAPARTWYGEKDND